MKAATLAALIAKAQREGLALVDARMLLLHTLGRPLHDRAWLMAHDEDPIGQEQAEQFDALVHRRLGGEPVAYLTGRKPFYGLELCIDARVLDPRDDTEALVDWALSLMPNTEDAQGGRALDLGTGSGAIALALANERPEWQITAVDQSWQALAVARSNASRLQLRVRWLEGHWMAPVTAEQFDLIVSNPPYIAEDDPHLPALTHEPLQALVSGPDGLTDIRHLISQAPDHLLPGGWLLLEHGWDQAGKVRELLSEAGFEHVQSRLDLSGIERCSGGQWSPSSS